MNTDLLRRSLGALAPCALVLLGSTSTPGPDPRPPCDRATIVLDDTIDSSRSHAGDTFRFQLARAATAPDGTSLQEGLVGYGIVSVAHPAERSGIPGYVVIDPRFLYALNGKHVPVTIDSAQAALQLVRGATANAPAAIGVVPYVSIGASIFNFVHHGKDATIWRGTRLPVLLGDDAIFGRCR